MKIFEILKRHARISNLMKIIDFNKRIMKIHKIMKLHMRIIKIIKFFEFHNRIRKVLKVITIKCESNENHENLRICMRVIMKIVNIIEFQRES